MMMSMRASSPRAGSSLVRRAAARAQFYFDSQKNDK